MLKHVCSRTYICTAFFKASTLKGLFLSVVSIFRQEISGVAFWSNVSAAYPSVPTIGFGSVNGVPIGSPNNKHEPLLYSYGFYFAFERLNTVIQISSIDGFFFFSVALEIQSVLSITLTD